MTEPDANLRWGMERRLEFIEFRLFWEGHVNRSDLMDTFKVSIAQVTFDLNRYFGLASGNRMYERSAKAHLGALEFKAPFQKPVPGRYLNQLRSVGDDIVEAGETWIRYFPAFNDTPMPLRSIGPVILRSVATAIRRKQAIEVKCQPLSRAEPTWLWIAPQPLGHNGFYWHTLPSARPVGTSEPSPWPRHTADKGEPTSYKKDRR